jgi:hypothetical protein
MMKNRYAIGRATHGVEDLVDQPEAREAHQRGHVLGVAVVVQFLGDRVERDLGAAHVDHGAVHGQHHALHGGHALVGGVEPEHLEAAGLRERHGAVAELVGGDTQVDGGPTLEGEQRPGEADAATGHHGGDICHAEQLRRRAVGAGVAGLAHPHPDGHLRVGHRLQELGHLGVADHRATRVELEDQRLGTVGLAIGDGVLDGLHRDRVEQAGDLQDVDRGQLSGRFAARIGRRGAPGRGCGAERKKPNHAHERGNKKGDR